MSTLAPFTTWPVQTDMLQRLYDAVDSGAVPHSMLFVGSPEIAREFTEYLARTLLCQSDVRPCGTCEACQWLAANTHPDWYVLEGEDGAAVKVAQIEALQEQLKLRAHAGGRTVYAIHDIHQMSAVAANRLLKTLEEPQPGIIALLTAASTRRVLPTILSRCFTYRLSPRDAAGWDDAVDEFFEEQSPFATLFQPMVQWAETLIRGSEPALSLADGLMSIADGRNLSDVFTVLVLWFRDLMHAATGDRHHIRFSKFATELERQATCAQPTQFAQAAAIVLESRSRLQAHVVGLLNTERMIIRLQEVFRSVHGHRRPL